MINVSGIVFWVFKDFCLVIKCEWVFKDLVIKGICIPLFTILVFFFFFKNSE